MTTEEELIKRVRELEDLVVFLAIDRNHDEAYVNWWYHNGGGQTMYRHDVATDTVHNSIINIRLINNTFLKIINFINQKIFI